MFSWIRRIFTRKIDNRQNSQYTNALSGDAAVTTAVQAAKLEGGVTINEGDHAPADNRQQHGTGNVNLGDVSGSVGPIIGNASGPVHTGSGHQITNVNHGGTVGTQTGIVNYGGHNVIRNAAVGDGATIINNGNNNDNQ